MDSPINSPPNNIVCCHKLETQIIYNRQARTLTVCRSCYLLTWLACSTPRALYSRSVAHSAHCCGRNVYSRTVGRAVSVTLGYTLVHASLCMKFKDFPSLSISSSSFLPSSNSNLSFTSATLTIFLQWL